MMITIPIQWNTQQLIMSKRGVQAQIGEWLTSLGVANQFNNQDLESGRTVASLLKVIDRNIKVQLQENSTAIARVSNWNNLTEALKQINIKITQEDKGKIINGSHEVIFAIISKLKQIHQRTSKETEITIKDIDPKRQVAAADSLLQLFLLALIKHFGLSPKEALSLLSNDSKYLAHILAKGLKGDFKPIQAFIAELAKNLPKIVTFCRNKENQSFLFRSIKPALISKSEIVAESSLQFLAAYLESVEQSSRIILLKEHLTATLVLVIRRHPHLIDKVVSSALQLVEFAPELLDQIVQLTAKPQLNNLLISLWRVYCQAKQEDRLVSAPAFDRLVSHANQALKQPQLAISSLSFCAELASSNFPLFSAASAEAVLAAFRQISLSKQSERLVFIHLCCTLMKAAGEEKHPLAPLIFKSLTAQLATTSGNQYETLAGNIANVIAEIPSIPTLPILQALSQRSDIKVSQPELLLFGNVLQLGAQARSAVAIFNLASRALVEDVGMGLQLGTVLAQVVNNFKEEEIVVDMTVKLIKVCLALYFANTKKLAQRRKPISYKTKLQGEQATSKLKILQIEAFLRKIITLGVPQVNSSIQPLLCFSYMQIAALSKDQNKNFEKSLQRILSLLGGVPQMISKYEAQLAENDPLKQSKAKHSPQHSPQNDYQMSNSPQYVQSVKRVRSSHPMSLSLAGVKNDAYMGLQKYVKMHQTRILAQESRRYQGIKAEEDRKALKKAYEKKMILEKGFKIRSVPQNQLQYIFEFNSKQDYARAQHLNLPDYSKDGEEERDASGLENMLRRYEKALRVYFTSYCGKKQGLTLKCFDDHLQHNSRIIPSAVIRLLTDHGLDSLVTAKEVQTLARRVNYRLGRIKDDPQNMDFEAFKQFIVQLAFTMYSRPPKDLRGHPIAEMLEELFSNLQLYAAQNRISAQLFAAPEASHYATESEAIKVLNQQLLVNPDYILPQGYKKVTETKVTYDYSIYLQAMSATYKDVYEVLDQILFSSFKFHIIQPCIKQEKLITARPNIYHLQRQKLAQTIQIKHIPVSLKKQVAKFPIKDRTTAKEAATALADIIQAVQLNHEEIGIKHQNPIVRSKKEQQEEQRRLRQVENRKRLNFDRQLKTTMGDYVNKRQEEKERKQKEKQEEMEKAKQERDRKEKRDRELKAKVQEFSQRKKGDEQAKKASQQSRIQKEKEDAQRKKRELEQTKRKIEQVKKQKEQQERAKKQQEKEQQRRRKEEEKKKFEKSQKQKKQKIEQFKSRKKGDSKVMDEPQQEAPNVQ